MVAMPIWLKTLKIFFSRINGPTILKLGKEHYVLKLFKVYISYDPEDLDLFYDDVNFGKFDFILILGPDIRCQSVNRTIGPNGPLVSGTYVLESHVF